jgi:signal transduction histidine kinase/HD-like signal output (HDOD) protein
MPQVLIELLNACRQEEVDLREVGRIVDKDSALTGKVLQLVNSAFIGARSSFVNIEQAVIYLGVDTIRNLAISVAVHQVFRKVKGNGLLSINSFWFHSHFCACLARAIAIKIGYKNDTEAYLAGLLHDLGKLLLWMAFPAKYNIALRAAHGQSGRALVAAEQDKIGIDHCQAGAELAELWSLPPFIGDAIRYHHYDIESLDNALDLVRITHLADAISHNHGQEDIEKENPARRFFNLPPSSVQELYRLGTLEVAEVANQLDIPLPQNNLDKTDDQEDDIGQSVNPALQQEVKNIAGISGALIGLLRAENVQQVVQVLNQSLKILFHEPTGMVLLHDQERKELYGTLSPENILQREADEVRFSIARNQGCLPIQALQSKSICVQRGKTENKEKKQLSNQQLLRLLNAEALACVPLSYQDQALGVLVIGLDEEALAPLNENSEQLEWLAAQAAVALYIFRILDLQRQRITAEKLDAAALVARKVAHEINNPLAILRNYLKILELKTNDHQGIKEELTIMDQELERLGHLTDQLSDLNSKKTPLHTEEIDLNQDLTQAVELFKLSLQQSDNVAVIFIPTEPLTPVTLDRNRLRQIMLNLLGNAVDAMQDGGEVNVSTSREGDMLIIAVADTGPGIDNQVADMLFSPGVTTKGDGHAGLGLSITQKLVQELGGTITVAREEQRTIFRVCFPI